jgi:hypothetical protein
MPGSYTNGGGSLLTEFNLQGDNTVSGHIRQLPINNLILLSINGENGRSYSGNTVSGSVNINALGPSDTRVWNPNIVTIQIIGENTVSGALSTFTNCTKLTRLVFRGESTTTPSAGATIVGALTDLPVTSPGANNTLQDLNLAGKMVVTGNLSTLTNFSVLKFLTIDGANTVSGDLSTLPLTIYSLKLAGQCTVNTYSTRRAWANPMNRFIVSPANTTVNRLSALSLQNMLKDLDLSNWEKYAGVISADISAYGQRTVALTEPATATAYASLQTKIITAAIGAVTITDVTP